MRHTLLLLPLATLFACDEPCKDGFERQKDGECYPAGSFDTSLGFDTAGWFDSGNPFDTGSPGPDLPQVSVSWGGSSLTLAVEGGQGPFSFGMAETGKTCDSGAGGCWTGEDCVYGFQLGDGTLLRYCHDVSGGGLSLSYAGNPIELAEGNETVFPDSSFESSVTYYLEDSSGACFTWGHNPGYYDAEGCTEL